MILLVMRGIGTTCDSEGHPSLYGVRSSGMGPGRQLGGMPPPDWPTGSGRRELPTTALQLQHTGADHAADVGSRWGPGFVIRRTVLAVRRLAPPRSLAAWWESTTDGPSLRLAAALQCKSYRALGPGACSLPWATPLHVYIRASMPAPCAVSFLPPATTQTQTQTRHSPLQAREHGTNKADGEKEHGRHR